MSDISSDPIIGSSPRTGDVAHQHSSTVCGARGSTSPAGYAPCCHRPADHAGAHSNDWETWPRDISSDPVCPTCGKAENIVCSNAFHLPRDLRELGDRWPEVSQPDKRDRTRDISSVTGSAAQALLDYTHGFMYANRRVTPEMVAAIQSEAVGPWRKFVEAYLGNAHEDELIAWAEDLLEGKTHE